jgi:hypothetical protein
MVTNNVFTRRQFLKLLPSGIVAVSSSLSSLENVFADPQDAMKDWKAEKVLDNGASESRYDLLFLPEGYIDGDRKKFDAHIDSFVKAFDKYAFFKEYGCLFNVRKIWVPSAAAWNSTGENKNTSFQITYNEKTRRTKSNSSIDFDDITKKFDADIPCFLINTDKTAGLGSYVMMACYNVPIMFHELGHSISKMKIVDEYPGATELGFNVSNDEKNPHWKQLINKAKGIGIYKIEDGRFKAEKECLMASASDGLDYGPMCTNGLIISLRQIVRPIEKATEEKQITLEKGQSIPFEAQLSASKSYVPSVMAFYQSGTADAMDALHDELKGKKLDFESFTDKKYKKSTVATQKNKSTITDKLPVGSHLIAVVAKDPNPAILMDPDKVTYDQRIYRVDVTEKK